MRVARATAEQRGPHFSPLVSPTSLRHRDQRVRHERSIANESRYSVRFPGDDGEERAAAIQERLAGWPVRFVDESSTCNRVRTSKVARTRLIDFIALGRCINESLWACASTERINPAMLQSLAYPRADLRMGFCRCALILRTQRTNGRTDEQLANANDLTDTRVYSSVIGLSPVIKRPNGGDLDIARYILCYMPLCARRDVRRNRDKQREKERGRRIYQGVSSLSSRARHVIYINK